MRASADGMAAAAQQFAAGALSEAALLLERLLDVDPDHGRAWELLGLICWRTGRRADALDCLEHASLLVPLRPEAVCGLAECYAASGQRDLALLLYQRAIEHPQSMVPTLLTAAAGIDEAGSPQWALRACRNALKQDPDSAQAHYDLSFYLGRLGRPASTVEAAARKAVQLAPDQVRFRVGLASWLARSGRTDDAYEVAGGMAESQVVELACTCCVLRLAELFQAVGDLERAGWCRVQAERLHLAAKISREADA